VGGHGVSVTSGLFFNQGLEGSLGEEVGDHDSGDGPEARPCAARVSGP